MHSRQELAAAFRALGVAAGDTVMLHASVRAAGEVAGGPDQIHLALKDALTEEGTLFMYAGCPDYYDDVGRGHLTPEKERDILDKLPAFDHLTARSQRDNGALVEMLRTYPGTVASDHVTRFVAWGRLAEHLVSTQPWDYAYGVGSPLHRFHECDGKILLLGSGHDAVTFLHYAEHIVDVPDKRVARFLVPVERNAERGWLPMEEFDTSAPAHRNWPEDLFAQLVDGYLDSTANAGGKVGDAHSVLFSARGLLDYALPIMKAMALDAV